jgi:signal transduction histidine kinase
MFRRSRLVYGLLFAVWAMVVAWQIVEHDRVKDSGRAALVNRSRDITTTLGLVIRSQRRWGGAVAQERVESALSELVKSGEVSSIALLNASGEVVASAGAPIDLEMKGMMQKGEHWDPKSLTIVNLVDLGASVRREGETNPPTIVLPRRDPTAVPPREEDRFRPRFDGGTNEPPPPNPGSPRREFGPREEEPGSPRSGTNNLAFTNAAAEPTASNLLERPGPPPGRRGGGPPRFGRPPWMDEKEYKSLVEKRGLHGLAIVLSTEALRRAASQDLWMRWIIWGFASISVVGLGLAWQNLVKSSELQMRLLRASELNNHLKEMNIAVAGLAHETRNPLNIIRGLAQMISKQEDASPEIRFKSREITDEADRVTAQLNEFINYSKPREVRQAPVIPGIVIGEVVRALECDVAEKSIRLTVTKEDLKVEADEQLLRQALFNLLLNAIQAVDVNGEIQIVVGKATSTEAFLDVRDSGPGVPLAQRPEIFKPYFTTQQKGTGLGLAVVQQIVLAHGWEVQYLANEPKGAVFRISHLKLSDAT